MKKRALSAQDYTLGLYAIYVCMYLKISLVIDPRPSGLENNKVKPNKGANWCNQVHVTRGELKFSAQNSSTRGFFFVYPRIRIQMRTLVVYARFYLAAHRRANTMDPYYT